MENSKAIEIFNKWMGCKDAYQADPSCDGNCLSCEHYTSAEGEKEAMLLAISALEKQEPMKPMAPELDPLGGITHPCGNCGGELVSKFHDFCPWCGQAIKWEK